MNSVSDRVAGRLPFFYGYVMPSVAMWVRYYGREHLGSIRGATWCCTVAVMSPLAILVWWATPPESAHLRNR
jgi:hypothetical protein